MDHKNTVCGLLISLATLTAQSECYVRNATVSKLTGAIERTTDVERSILPHGKGGFKCQITFRAYIDGKWHLAMGEDIGNANASLDQVCAKAMQSGRINIMESVSGTKVTGNQEMICTDRPLPESRAVVNIGDTVWESEVQMHPIHRNPFSYRGSYCRWFVESKPQVGKVDLTQGIICRSRDQTAWLVVDKW